MQPQGLKDRKGQRVRVEVAGEVKNLVMKKNKKERKIGGSENHQRDWKGGVCVWVGVGLPITLSPRKVDFFSASKREDS